MEAIGSVGRIKISNNGMIANINLDNTAKNKAIMNIYKLEDKVILLDFIYCKMTVLIHELNEQNCIETSKSLVNASKKLLKEIKSLKRTIKNLWKIV